MRIVRGSNFERFIDSENDSLCSATMSRVNLTSKSSFYVSIIDVQNTPYILLHISPNQSDRTRSAGIVFTSLFSSGSNYITAGSWQLDDIYDWCNEQRKGRYLPYIQTFILSQLWALWAMALGLFHFYRWIWCRKDNDGRERWFALQYSLHIPLSYAADCSFGLTRQN